MPYLCAEVQGKVCCSPLCILLLWPTWGILCSPSRRGNGLISSLQWAHTWLLCLCSKNTCGFTCCLQLPPVWFLEPGREWVCPKISVSTTTNQWECAGVGEILLRAAFWKSSVPNVASSAWFSWLSLLQHQWAVFELGVRGAGLFYLRGGQRWALLGGGCQPTQGWSWGYSAPVMKGLGTWGASARWPWKVVFQCVHRYVGLLACMVLLFLYPECCLWIITVSRDGRGWFAFAAFIWDLGLLCKHQMSLWTQSGLELCCHYHESNEGQKVRRCSKIVERQSCAAAVTLKYHESCVILPHYGNVRSRNRGHELQNTSLCATAFEWG